MSSTMNLLKQLVLGCAVTLTTSVDAAQFTFLTNEALQGKVTFDPFLGNADDAVFAGINTLGAASQFLASNGVYGFLGGSMSTQGVTPFGPTAQQYFGRNEFTAIDMFGEWNVNPSPLFPFGSFNNPFQQSLAGDATYGLEMGRDQTFTTSFVLDDTGFDGRIRITGSGRYLLSYQRASELYDGDIRTHFETVLPLLPSGWLGVAQETQTWEVLDGAFAGVTGTTSVTFYSSDPNAVPVEPLMALGPPWSTSGFAAAQGENVLVGGQFGSGTAKLQDAVADVDGLLWISARDGATGAVTVTGATAGLTVDDGITFQDANFFQAEADGGQLNIDSGARVAAPFLSMFEPPSAGPSAGPGPAVSISGAGTTLALECTVPDCTSQYVTGLIVGAGRVDVSAGGRVRVDGQLGQDVNGVDLRASATLIVGEGGTVTVDGIGSTLSIEHADPTRFGTALQIPGFYLPAVDLGGATLGLGRDNETATLQITNGGTVIVADTDSITSVAGNTGEAALLQISGAGSTFVAATVNLGAPLPSMLTEGGTGTITVEDGGRLVAETIRVGVGGTINGDGGVIDADVSMAGTLAPGASPGRLVIDGNLTLENDGLLVIELGGPAAVTQYDVLEVTGTLTLGGTLDIRLIDGYVPGADESFDFLIASAVLGEFADVLLPELGNGRRLVLAFGAKGAELAVSAVPLPATAPLLLSALCGLGLMRRSRQCAQVDGV